MFDRLLPCFAQRSKEAELIDGTNYGLDEYVSQMSDLRRINRYLGGKGALTKHLFPMIEAAGRRRVRLLDIGTGSADIPIFVVEWARQHGLQVEFTVIDLNEIAAAEAGKLTRLYPEITVVRANAMRLPFADDSFDFVMASLFVHHFESDEVGELLKDFSRIARQAFIINDLRRHPLAYFTIRILTRLFTRNRLVRHDSAVSVLRGFTDEDIAEIEKASNLRLEVFRHFPYRYIFINRRSFRDLLTAESNKHDNRRSVEGF